MSKKKVHFSKIINKGFLLLFRKFPTLKKFAIKALMNNESDLNIFNSLKRFHNCSIIDIMIPRNEICAVDIDLSRHKIIKKIRDSHHTKILVYKSNFDNMIGFFYVKEIVFNIDKTLNLKDLIHNILYVPQSMKTTNLFIKMKSTKSYVAIVLDEYGGTDGLISITDLIGEMIPSFNNENEVQFECAIVKLSGDKFEVPARILVKDIEENLNIKLRDHDEDYITIGGLVLSIAGKVPSIDEIIEYKNGIRFTIKEANERCIRRVILDLSNYEGFG